MRSPNLTHGIGPTDWMMHPGKLVLAVFVATGLAAGCGPSPGGAAKSPVDTGVDTTQPPGPPDASVAPPSTGPGDPRDPEDPAAPPGQPTDPTNPSNPPAGSADGGTPPPTTPGEPGSPDGGPVLPPDPCQGMQPADAPMRLLTRVEYDNTVRDLLGDTSAPARAFPPENQVLGFDNNAEAHQASPLLVQKYLETAEGLAATAMTQHRDLIVPCAATALAQQQSGAGEAPLLACASSFVDGFGRRAFRRPLTTEEVGHLNGLFTTALAEHGFNGALTMVLQAMLQSPQFLYRIHELQPADATNAVVPLPPFEMASRLSYLLWSSTPDDTLLDAAANGQLSSREGVITQARRMVADPKAHDTVRNFHRQWLQLDRLDNITKDMSSLPFQFQGLGRSWKESVLAFVDHAVFEAESFLDTLFTSNTVYLNHDLASVLQVPGVGVMQPVDLPADERAGLLTQPGMMALLAHPSQSSPVARGVFVRQQLLCNTLPPPPADVVIEPPDPDPNATTRERFRQHTENASCQGCHVMIDPIGFGFENYDALGRFRATENGLPVDGSGELLFTEDPQIEGPFVGAVQLGSKLRESSQVRNCMVRQWYRFATGRGDVGTADRCNVTRLQASFARNGGDIKELLVELASSDAFRLRPAFAPETNEVTQ